MLRFIALCCIASGLGPALAQEAAGPAGPLYVYSARFFCSEATDLDLPANCDRCFSSEIGLVNTGSETANVTIWAVEARPIFVDPPPTRSEPAVELELAPNDAVRIGCGSLNRLLPAEEMLGRARKAQPNGFLRFDSDQRIKAVATYVFRMLTQYGEGAGAGVSLEVVEIEPEGEE